MTSTSRTAALERARDHLRRHAHERVTLTDLARVSGLSRAHFQRAFTAAYGCSPKAWQRAERDRLLRDGLRAGGGVAGAVYGAGFGSGSRVYESARARLGMTPGRYARGGDGVAISYAIARTGLGRVLIAASDDGICAVRFGDDDAALRRELAEEFPRAALSPMPRRSTAALRTWLDLVLGAIDGAHAVAYPPLAPRGTAFQVQVWELLRRIPRGALRSYAALARDLGRPRSARAVARACAGNPIAVLIPCHRVIRGDGDPAGYRWGLERKRRLIARERQR